MATPNIADRSNQVRKFVAPVEFTNADGVKLTVAAAATDTTTAIALANSLRTQLIALGVVASA